MDYSLTIAIGSLLLLLVYGGSFLVVGRACRKVLFASSSGGAGTDLLLGFLAAPMLIAVFCAATGARLWLGLVVLDSIALGIVLYLRSARPASPMAAEMAPVILPLRVSSLGLLLIFGLALLLNVPYLTGLFGLPLANGNVDIGPEIFDIEPALGITTSLAAYGFPPRHHAADSVPLLYYTGFYVMPAAVAGLLPSLMIPALVGAYVFGSVAFLLVVWQLMSRHFPTLSWRLLAAILFLSGTTLGVFCWNWTPFLQKTFLRAYVEQGFHLDTILQCILWMPRHTLPALLALLVLEAFTADGYSRGLLKTLFFPLTYLTASSIYVGLFLTPALLVSLVLAWRSQAVAAQGDNARSLLRPTSLIWFVTFSAIVVLPHYWTTFAAFTHAGAPTGRLTHALCSPPVVGTLLMSCGVGLAIGLPICFTSGRRGALWLVYLLTLLVAILTSTFNSDFALKGTNILMLLVSLMSTLALHRLWTQRHSRGPAFHVFTVILLAAVMVFSLQSLAVGLRHPAGTVPQLVQWRRQISKPGFELVCWVRQHTRMEDKVSLVQNDRTIFEPLFGRVAFAAGPDALYNGQALWADESLLKQHQDAYPDLLGGMLGSDYVVLCRDSLGFGSPRIQDTRFDEHCQMVRSLGFSILMKNEGGLVARNPARTPEERQALLARLPHRSFSNGFHSGLANTADVTKWVQVDLGKSVAIDDVHLIPARPPDWPDCPGFGFPVRFRVELDDSPDFVHPRIAADYSCADFRNPGAQVVRIPIHGQCGRYVRVVATRLWRRDAVYLFALAELQVMSKHKNLAHHATVTALDSVEGGRWGSRYLVDGFDSYRSLSQPILAKAALATAP